MAAALVFRVRTFSALAALTTCLFMHTVYADLTSLARNDPYPVYKAVDPTELLYTWDKLWMKEYPLEIDRSQTMSIALSAFGQNACVGKDRCGIRVPLGDLHGRWNMIGLLMGPLPEGKTLPAPLAAALQAIFPGMPQGTLNDPNIVDPNQTFGFFSLPLKYYKRGLRWEFTGMFSCNFGFIFQGGVADICQKVCNFDNLTCMSCNYKQTMNGDGCVNTLLASNCNPPNPITTQTPGIAGPLPLVECTAPANAASKSVPLNCCGRICDATILCCGRKFNESVSSPNPDGTGPNLARTIGSSLPKYPNLTTDLVNQYLMNELRPIADAIGLNICDFHTVSIEDLRLSLFWRSARNVNLGREGWAEFLFEPYLMAGVSIGSGKEQNTNCAFSLPFGNNGHTAMGATGGLNLDFVDTIEIGSEVGFTGFFGKNFCNYRVPNQVPNRNCQLGIAPFTTDVYIKPGFNWHWNIKMLAWHFIDRLSFYGQYVLLHHEDDKICLKTPDITNAFDVRTLENESCFKVQLLNLGFYYDIAPQMSLGLFIQAPLSQRRAYQSTTVMFSLWATY